MIHHHTKSSFYLSSRLWLGPLATTLISMKGLRSFFTQLYIVVKMNYQLQLSIKFINISSFCSCSFALRVSSLNFRVSEAHVELLQMYKTGSTYLMAWENFRPTGSVKNYIPLRGVSYEKWLWIQCWEVHLSVVCDKRSHSFQNPVSSATQRKKENRWWFRKFMIVMNSKKNITLYRCTENS